MLTRHARCVLSRLRCNGHSQLLALISLGLAKSKILLGEPADTRPRTLLISFYTLQLRILCPARSLATLCLFTNSGPKPGEFLGFWGSIVFRHASIPWKGSSNNKNRVVLAVDQAVPKCKYLYKILLKM